MQGDVKMSCCFCNVALAEWVVRFSKSWRSGEVLGGGKKVNIAPLFLKGHEDDPGSYRLVSATLVHREIVERILLGHISGQEKEEKVHGCTKGKSCLSNLIAFWMKRIRLGGEGRAVDAIYLATFQCFLLQYPRVSPGWDKIRMSGTNNG